MRTSTKLWIVQSALSIALLAVVAPAAAAQSSPCRAMDGTAERLIWYLRELVTSGSESGDVFVAIRQRYQLPQGDSADVQLVANDSVCAAAVVAYDSLVAVPVVAAMQGNVGAVPTVQTQRASVAMTTTRQLYVIQVGPSRYVVLDPEDHQNEGRATTAVMNGAFTQLLVIWL